MRALFLLLTLSSPFLSGCKASYKDIGQEADFSGYIGEKYILISDMDFSGVSAPPGYSDEIHYYVISSRDPGWSGPEVVTRKTIEKGTIVTITSVKECTNCLTLGKPLRHVLVTTNDIKINVKLPIKLYLREIELGKHIEKLPST